MKDCAVGPAATRFFRDARAKLAGRATLLLVALAFLAVSLIGGVGIGLSVAVVEQVRGSGSAINAAGNLRRLAHRAGQLALVAASDGPSRAAALRTAIDEFEAGLAHPALTKLLARGPHDFPSIYRDVSAAWHAQVKPRLVALPASGAGPEGASAREALLADVDRYADRIDALVSLLERDTDAGIEDLRLTLAIALAALLAVVAAALHLIRRRVFAPLNELRGCAARIAAGDFEARSTRTGSDELGRMGVAFNAMADELSAAYRNLEQRVERKTADLTRSNRMLELLYHVIARLHEAPVSPDTYRETTKDLEQVLGLEGSQVCMLPKHGGGAELLASSIGDCTDRANGDEDCANCPGRSEPPGAVPGQLLVPLRHAGRLHGMLRVSLPAGERLQPWQRTLIDAVARHMGIALGLSHQSERERLLALQEERSVIARELHDSLAQSLSYMKIQASLLAPAMQAPERREEAFENLTDLREGISAAYRQLRELLSTFRLAMDGDFGRLLAATIDEYAGRSGLPIDLEIRLAHCRLNPNQEIHVLHVIREALSNATRHAAASRIRVALTAQPDGAVDVVVEDDGKGLDSTAASAPYHYGLTIMRERACGLGGSLMVEPCASGGTRVRLRFRAAPAHNARRAADQMESQ